MEEVQQLPLSELSEGCVGTLRSQRRIASEAPLALGAGPEHEQQPEFILPINRDAARGIDLPDGAVYRDGGSCHTGTRRDRKSTRLNSSHSQISYAVFCLKKKNTSGRPRSCTPTASCRKQTHRSSLTRI